MEPDSDMIPEFRSSHYAQGSYDPFSTRPLARYSPPRGDVADGLGIDPFSAGRNVSLYEPLPSGSAPYGYAVMYQGAGGQPPSRRQSLSQSYADYDAENHQRGTELARSSTRYHTKRRPFNQDEFDGPSQYLPLPLPQQDHSRAQDLPDLPFHLDLAEQDEIMRRANDILSECAFHFVAKYQFPIPLERDKPRVRSPADREWTEWAYLLKRLATKRRIPARVLYDNQIKQLVTTLENSIAARQTANKDQPNPKRKPKDDRYILQLVSAGTQVARILMDSCAMKELDDLYARTEAVILERRRRIQAQSGSL